MTFVNPETGEVLSRSFMPGEEMPETVYMAADFGVDGGAVGFYDEQGRVIHLDTEKDEQERKDQPSNQKDGPDLGSEGGGGDAGSEATGAGPSGGADTGGGSTGSSDATGAGPSGGA